MADTLIGIKALLAEILTRIETLATGQTWTTETGQQAVLATYLYRLPNEALDKAGAGPFPYLAARPMGGSQEGAEGRFRIRLFAGICNPGEDGEGDEDLERIATLLLRLPYEQNYAPFALEPEISLQFGDKESGQQAHPEYYMSADLWFSREAVNFFN